MFFYYYYSCTLVSSEAKRGVAPPPKCTCFMLLPEKKYLVDTKPKDGNLHWTLTSDFTPLYEQAKKKKGGFIFGPCHTGVNEFHSKRFFNAGSSNGTCC